jgi:predicted amidohydrolase YtcJ
MTMGNVEDIYADLVLLNGKVVTVDADDSVAGAVAVKGSRIVGVGKDDEIRRLVGEKTEVHDLEGPTVLPGLIDSHMHPGSVGDVPEG